MPDTNLTEDNDWGVEFSQVGFFVREEGSKLFEIDCVVSIT